MSGLLVLAPEVDWTASGGLFDWTLEFLINRVSDDSTVERLREILDNNLGSMWVSEFPPRVQEEVCRLLQEGIVSAGERDLPVGEHKAAAVRSLEELAELARARLTAS
jgi:RNase P/RNase MRP subunit POP5